MAQLRSTSDLLGRIGGDEPAVMLQYGDEAAIAAA